MTIRSFRDLRVWHMAMDLVETVYALTTSFPANERYGLASQIQRAAVSVPSNIAEGHTRHHLKEYLQYLSLAQASLAELDTQLEIALRLKYLSEAECAKTQDRLESLGRQLRSLRRALRDSPQTPST